MPTLDELLAQEGVKQQAQPDPQRPQAPSLNDLLAMETGNVNEFGRPEPVDEYEIEIPEQDRDTWDKFKHAWLREDNFLTNSARILESHFPLGEIAMHWEDAWEEVPAYLAAGQWDKAVDAMIISPEEQYGEGWKDASPQERRDMAYEKKIQELDEVYGEYDPSAGISMAGAFAKALTDPVNLLIPAGRTVAGAASLGAAAGAGFSVSEDVARGQGIDWMKAAATGLVGAGGGATFRVVGNKIGTRMKQKKADKVLTKAQQVVQDDPDITYQNLAVKLAEAGVNPDDVGEATKLLNRKLRIPSPGERAIRHEVTEDSAVSRLYSDKLDKYLGNLSTRLRNISDPLFARLRKHEYDLHVQTQNLGKAVEPWTNDFTKLWRKNRNHAEALTRLLYNGKRKEALAFMDQVDPKMGRHFRVVIDRLEAVGDDLRANGHTFEKLENYFPRLVKDHEGLLNALGSKKRSRLKEAMKQYADSKKIQPHEIPKWKREEITDLVVRGYRPTVDKGKFSFVRQRQIDEVTPELMKFYATPDESLHKYLRGAINDIERRKFFGRTARNDEAGKFDPKRSIGALIDEEVEAGNIPMERQDEVIDMLQARFVTGEIPMGKFLGLIRSLGYMATIGNPLSAITQLGDLAVSGALQGARGTLKNLFGKKHVKLIDLGLDDVVTEELADPALWTKGLNFSLRYSGFKWIDRLGKETYINAALQRARAQAKAGNAAAIRKKWGKVFGPETELLISDLRNGRITDNVKLMLFNELSDIQPISLSEMPEGYLRHPDGRIMYMLKSFMLKQYDIVRRGVVQEWKKGNRKEAIKNGARLWAFLSLANMNTQIAKDIMLGREVKPEDLPSRAAWSLLGVYGLNEYSAERYLAAGDVPGFIFEQMAPPTGIFEAAGTGAVAIADELKGEDADYGKTLKAIPIAGPIMYNYFGGGLERYEERQRRDD